MVYPHFYDIVPLIEDCGISVPLQAAIKLLKDNKADWEKSMPNVPFTAGVAYLMHQQGPSGAKALLKNPNKNVVEVLSRFKSDKYNPVKVVTNNGGRTDMTAGEFANSIMSKAQSLVEAYNGQTSGGATFTSSDTSSAPVQQTGGDTQSALDKLLSDIETDEFRAKTEEEQAAMRAEIDSLKAQLAEQNQNQEQQPTGETSEPTTVEQQVTKEVQDDTFKQVLRFAQVLDDNHLTRLVEAGAISEEHLAQLRELSATKRMLTEMRDTDAVSKTVFEGNTAKTLEESDRGLNTYMLALETAMSSGRTGLAEKILPDLDRWHQSHGTKALAAASVPVQYSQTPHKRLYYPKLGVISHDKTA